MVNHPNRAAAFGKYTIRINGTGPRLLPDSFWAETSHIHLGEMTREAAIAAYDKIRAETYKQQVTLYGPKGNRVREGLGTAAAA
jgi:hypothetical protein